jgi:aspartyl-tRNA(Asn)/glutamyl-tRNA(Gln) amidotransferase subunit A
LSAELSRQSAIEIVQGVAQGSLSATEVVSSFLQVIDRNREINAFTTVAIEEALTAAADIDRRRASGGEIGVLAGLPIAVKDGICTAGIKTTAGSKILSRFVPPYDATIVERLKQADAIVLGKTNMDEFAMGSSTENSSLGPTLNPWSRDRVAGGSSGGSAASVAVGAAPVAIGSDTGGSIRQPAAFCGVTGLKPTYGRVSRFGLIAYASSLDQIGPMARSAEECAMIMNRIAGHDPRDSTSSHQVEEDFSITLNQPLKGLKIGICREHFGEGLEDEVSAALLVAIDQLEQLGAILVEHSLPYSPYAVPAYYVIASCEASSNLARYDGVRYTARSEGSNLDQMYSRTREEFFGVEVKRRIMLGTFALSAGYYDAYYLQASKVRHLIKQDFDRVWKTCDLIVGPTTPTPAFRIGEHSKDPLEMYLADIYTVSANLAGIPALSIPVGFTKAGLPIGMQLQGPMFEEVRLLQVAHQYQQASDWHLRWPPGV